MGSQCLKIIAVSFFVIVFFAAILQIVMRWLFGNPLVWTEELIRLMFVWICFLGWVFATKNSSHITINAVVDLLGPRFRKILDIFNALLVIIFSSLMVYYGIKMTVVGRGGWAVTLPINFAIVYVICPITNFLIVIYQISHLVEFVKTSPSKEKKERSR